MLRSSLLSLSAYHPISDSTRRGVQCVAKRIFNTCFLKNVSGRWGDTEVNEGRLVVLTGAGISAESGVPTFRGSGGYSSTDSTRQLMWRNKYDAASLASAEVFAYEPSLVWQFYEYRRNYVSICSPNPGHYALARLRQLMVDSKNFDDSNDGNIQDDTDNNGNDENIFKSICQNKFLILTQNVDRLHHEASKSISDARNSTKSDKVCDKDNTVDEKDSDLGNCAKKTEGETLSPDKKESSSIDENQSQKQEEKKSVKKDLKISDDYIIELHGSLWLVKPDKYPRFLPRKGHVWENRTLPICKALAPVREEAIGDAKRAMTMLGIENKIKNNKENEKIKPTFAFQQAPDLNIPIEDLPHGFDPALLNDKNTKDDKPLPLLRPAVVWFGEPLDPDVAEAAAIAVSSCDILLVVGTSGVVYPAAAYADFVRNNTEKRRFIAHFNLDEGNFKNSNTTDFENVSEISIVGPSGVTLPLLLEELEKLISNAKKEGLLK